MLAFPGLSSLSSGRNDRRDFLFNWSFPFYPTKMPFRSSNEGRSE